MNSGLQSFNLRDYTTDMLYDHLRGVYERARRCFAREGDKAYDFQEADGRINLIGVRGFLMNAMEPSGVRTNKHWDDTLFMVFKEGGNKRVISYQISTEHRDEEGPSSLMMPGMYKYRLGFHKRGKITVKKLNNNGKEIENGGQFITTEVPRPRIPKTCYATEKNPGGRLPARQHLSNTSENPNTGTTIEKESWAYRALNPRLDENDKNQIIKWDNSLTPEPDEPLEPGHRLNIHYGGEKVTGPGNYSEGCQVIYGWKNYCAFIEMLEKDRSLDGTDKNQIADPVTAGEKRPVIYTLVEGHFLKPPAVGYPLLGETAESLFAKTEASKKGLFPIGSNRFWHGGVHLEAESKTPIRAVADGEVVAYRLDKEAKTVTMQGVERKFATGFVLMRHRFKTPKGAAIEFFSHYMHLLPFSSYQGDEKGPSFLAKRSFKVATATDGRGLRLRSAADYEKILAVVPKGALLELDMSAGPPAAYPKKAKHYRKASWRGLEGYLDTGTLKGPTVRKMKNATNLYLCAVARDLPSAATKLGLSVYTSDRFGSELARIEPKGSELKFLVPSAVVEDDKPIPGWWLLEDGNWVMVTRANIACAITIEPDKLDEVVIPDGCGSFASEKSGVISSSYAHAVAS